MSPTALADALFALRIEAEGLTSMLSAIHMAMLTGDYHEETYTPALWLLSNLMDEHHKKLHALSKERTTA